MSAPEMLPDDPWQFRTGSIAVRASCLHCGKDLQPFATAPPTGVCVDCGYSVELCGDHLQGLAGGKWCVREKGHKGWHLSPSGTGWGNGVRP